MADTENFKSYIVKKNRVISFFSLLLITVYLLFNLLIVIAPSILNAPWSDQLPIPIGIFVGIGSIIFFGVVTVIYAVIANKMFDPVVEQNLLSKD